MRPLLCGGENTICKEREEEENGGVQCSLSCILLGQLFIEMERDWFGHCKMENNSLRLAFLEVGFSSLHIYIYIYIVVLGVTYPCISGPSL